MVSYNYPPVGAYGAVRTTKLAKYLPSYGWLPTVLTVSHDRTKWGGSEASEGILPAVKVLRAPFPDPLTAAKDLLLRLGTLQPSGPGAETRLNIGGSGETRGLQRSTLSASTQALASWIKRWASFPDRYGLWFPFAVVRGLVELRAYRYEAIYSTSPPVMDHMVAATLQRITGLPWLADFRDPWSQNPYLNFTPTQARLLPWLEKKVISNAGAIVTVSRPLARRLEELHGTRPSGVHSITNGYDPDDFPAAAEATPSGGPFTITYTGMFYGTKRDPTAVLEVIEELVEECFIGPDELRLRLYGPEDPAVLKLKESLDHPEILQIEGVVPHAEALRRQRGSTVLLTLLWDNPYSAVGYGGKVFEYLGSARPILAWNPAGGVLAEMLDRTAAGVSVADRAELKEVLVGWIDEFRRTGSLTYRVATDEVRRFAWDRLAGDMSAVLEGLTRRGHEMESLC